MFKKGMEVGLKALLFVALLATFALAASGYEVVFPTNGGTTGLLVYFDDTVAQDEDQLRQYRPHGR